MGNKTLFEIKINKENDDINLFLKSCGEYEKYLKKTKKIITKSNFCGTEKDIKIYDGTIESNGIDNANNNIISNGSFNLAILRIVGISNGVDLKLNGLISIEELPNTIKNFLTRAKKVYLDKIKEFKAEGVLKENDL